MPRRLPAKPRGESDRITFYKKMYEETRAMRKIALNDGSHTAAAKYHSKLIDLYEAYSAAVGDGSDLGLDNLTDAQLTNLIIKLSDEIPDALAQDLFVHLAERLRYPLGPRLVGEK